ncbi:glycosyltransferase family 2 protein [Phyllobacterium myrsinacearum]|uniref:Glycosyltransferase family 2 protein n=1 Tax=Phyllobacterium myrsinacearum TaxID=28101 RepID=A0A839EDI6_9HYPH|nr:glycosyltransferase family 2 protein [Phyllobacterium myrsinacearum]MBA8876385.1 hypothetical protein [Phyllobacterium myrsinacearum]
MPIQYPISNPADWLRLEKPSFLRRAKSHLYHYTYPGASKALPNAIITKVSGPPVHPAKDDILAICIVKNAIGYIHSFLRYYRKLGVTRFAFLDDQSNDGTSDILRNAPDVDLFTSPISYAEAARGKAWRDALFKVYGPNRWYLSLDADEFLVFPGSEEIQLPEFIRQLEKAGIERCHAPMLDLYPAGPLNGDPFIDDGSRWPFDVSSHFDGDSYTIKLERYGTSVRGGPRKRFFGRDMRLSKFPLIWVDGATSYQRGSIHGPGPCSRNFVPITAVLLHYRFSNQSINEFRNIVAHGGHADGGAHYGAMLDHPDFGEDFSLTYDGSVKFSGSADLVKRGFMMKLPV